MNTKRYLCAWILVGLCSSQLLAKTTQAKSGEYLVGPANDSLNFGVLVHNQTYTIYRSTKLGESGLDELKKYLSKKALPFPKTIVYMNSAGYSFPYSFALEEYCRPQMTL